MILTWAFGQPSQTGGQNRLTGLIECLAKAGWNVYLLMLSHNDFSEKSKIFAEWKKHGVVSIHLRIIRRTDHYLGLLIHNVFHVMPALRSPLIRYWVRRHLWWIDPSVVLTNVVEFTTLVLLADGKHRAIDCVDIWLRHLALIDKISKRFPWESWTFPAADDPYLAESFFNKCNELDLKNEMQMLATFNTILTISGDEADEIRKFVHNSTIELIPMCIEPVDMGNTHLGPPLMVGHNHPFNAQAYAYFVQRVLPCVLVLEPSFSFRVIGNDTKKFPSHPVANILGFVNNIGEEYRAAAFMIVPVLGGTGQLTRVVEGMANGLPVIATRSAARSSPIRHGINGFIADDADQFAKYVVLLYRNRDLAISMGRAALETVRAEYSKKHLQQRLTEIFKRR